MQPHNLGRTLWRWGWRLAVVALSFWLALRATEWQAFVAALREVPYGSLGLFVPVIVLSHLVRAWRWQWMVRAAIGRAPRLGSAFAAVMVGYAVNALVPRLGELVRPYALSRREQIPMATLLSSVVAERLLDVVTLALLVVGGGVLFAGRFSSALGGHGGVLLSLAVAGVAVALLATLQRWGGLILRWLRPRLPGIAQHGERLIEEFRAGVRPLGQLRVYGPVGALTILLWFLYWVPLYGLCWLLELPLGPVEAFQILLVSAVAISVAPTPSAAGVYHVTVQMALVELFAVPAATALAYATLAHGVNTLVSLAVGGVCWLWLQPRHREQAAA